MYSSFQWVAKIGCANITRTLLLYFLRICCILKVANGWGISYVPFFMFQRSRKADLFYNSSRDVSMSCFSVIWITLLLSPNSIIWPGTKCSDWPDLSRTPPDGVVSHWNNWEKIMNFKKKLGNYFQKKSYQCQKQVSKQRNKQQSSTIRLKQSIWFRF